MLGVPEKMPHTWLFLSANCLLYSRVLPALDGQLGESALEEQASQRLGQAYAASGDYGRAAELLRWSVEAADRGSRARPGLEWRQVSRGWRRP